MVPSSSYVQYVPIVETRRSGFGVFVVVGYLELDLPSRLEEMQYHSQTGSIGKMDFVNETKVMLTVQCADFHNCNVTMALSGMETRCTQKIP